MSVLTFHIVIHTNVELNFGYKKNERVRYRVESFANLLLNECSLCYLDRGYTRLGKLFLYLSTDDKETLLKPSCEEGFTEEL